MTTLQTGFELAPAGTAIPTSGVAGDGDAFSGGNDGSGNTFVSDSSISAALATGSYCGKLTIGATAAVTHRFWNLATSTPSFRIFLYLTAAPNASVDLVAPINGGIVARLRVTSSLNIAHLLGSTVTDTTTGTIPLNTLVRIEGTWGMSTTAGTFTVDCYAGQSTTPLAGLSLNLTGLAMSQASAASMRFGVLNSSVTSFTLYTDGWGVSDAGRLGPAVTSTPATVTGVTGTATATAPAGTVSAGSTVTGATATGTATAPAGTASASATVVGATATSTAAAPAGTVLLGAVIPGATATATAAAPAGNPTAGALIPGATATGTGTAPTGTPTVAVALPGATATATASAPAGTPQAGATVAGATATASATAPAGATFVADWNPATLWNPADPWPGPDSGTGPGTVTGVTATATGSAPAGSVHAGVTISGVTATTTALAAAGNAHAAALLAGATATASATGQAGGVVVGSLYNPHTYVLAPLSSNGASTAVLLNNGASTAPLLNNGISAAPLVSNGASTAPVMTTT